MEEFEGEECDEGIVQNQQIFDFVDVPSFVSLFTCNPAELLYFVKGNEKGTAIKDMRDPYNHFIHTSELFFKGNHLKLKRWRSSNNKKIPNPFDLCIIPPLKTYMILAQRSITICNWHKYALVAKAHIWFDIGDILRSFFIS